MKRDIILIITLLLSCTLFAQNKKDFDELVKQTNFYLSIYGKLSPFPYDVLVNLKEMGFSKADIHEIQASEYIENKDSVLQYELISILSDKIEDQIQEIIYHPEFRNQKDIEKLLISDDLSIVKSDDGKLYNFSLDEKTGGTFRSRTSLMYYSEFSPSQNFDEKNFDFYQNTGFDNIYSLETDEGIKYVLTGYSRLCSMCFSTYVLLIKENNGRLVQDFYYEVTLRTWEEGVSYDEKEKTIAVSYTTDDLTKDCYCTYPDEYYEKDQEEYNSKVCECLFIFNGNNFELVKESEEIIIE